MMKKLAAAAGIAAGLAVLAPSAAYAGDTGFRLFTVQPGQTTCLADTQPAYSYARGEAAYQSGHKSRFTFGQVVPAPRVIADSLFPTDYFGTDVSATAKPKLFPAYFQVCAINQSDKVSTVAMRVSGY